MENRGGGLHICTQEKSIITLTDAGMGGTGGKENKSKKDDAHQYKAFPL